LVERRITEANVYLICILVGEAHPTYINTTYSISTVNRNRPWEASALAIFGKD
jgi:hypothetical protein